MNLKKYIRLKEENIEEISCAEENKERYQQLYAQVQANEAAIAAVKKPIKMWAGIATLFVIIAAVVIAVSIIFAPKNPIDIFYKEENILSITPTYEAMESNIKKFDLRLDTDNVEQITLFYDNVSKDKLYYNFRLKYDNDRVDFVVKINKNYSYNFDLDDDVYSVDLPDYTVEYCKISRRGEPYIRYRGYIDLIEETVYFDYTQSPASGDEAFLESIQSIVKVK